jgi:hypothetical protein
MVAWLIENLFYIIIVKPTLLEFVFQEHIEIKWFFMYDSKKKSKT